MEPLILTRAEESQELTRLNDRLRLYINKIHRLEFDAEHLRVKI